MLRHAGVGGMLAFHVTCSRCWCYAMLGVDVNVPCNLLTLLMLRHAGVGGMLTFHVTCSRCWCYATLGWGDVSWLLVQLAKLLTQQRWQTKSAAREQAVRPLLLVQNLLMSCMVASVVASSVGSILVQFPACWCRKIGWRWGMSPKCWFNGADPDENSGIEGALVSNKANFTHHGSSGALIGTLGCGHIHRRHWQFHQRPCGSVAKLSGGSWQPGMKGWRVKLNRVIHLIHVILRWIL